MVSLPPLQFGIPGGPELLVILLIAVLLFGANKIPKLARSTGEAMGEFQKGREEVEQELQEMREGATPEASDTSETEPAVETERATAEAGAETETATASEEDLEIDDAESDTEAGTEETSSSSP
jgi:sec-independent protein translocase protein TatA